MPRRPSHSTFRAFSLDPASADPLHRQLYDEMRRAILNGRIAPGSRLPASRELASVSRVSRNTVLSAYEQLLAEGYIHSRPGSGTFVADAVPESFVPEPAAPVQDSDTPAAPRPLSRRAQRAAGVTSMRHPVQPLANAFRPGLPALDQFPMDVLRRIADRRLRRASVRMLVYGDPMGYLPLREAIAAHLTASRGARCDASRVLIVNGAQGGIALCAQLLVDEGDRVWMEDPGYFAARASFELAGARVVPVPVDAGGLDVAAGVALAPGARLAYCTPSHQNPTGVTMSLPRRTALLQWARRAGAWILEDDNASEYRYRGRPLAALQGIDPSDRVIYLGTFSKVLFSSLRVGYLVLPPDLVEVFSRVHEIESRGTSALVQGVLADFMTEGHFARHLRRMRTLYTVRMAALERAVAEIAADVLELRPIEGGLNRLVMLPPGVDEAAVAGELGRSNVIAVPLSAYTPTPSGRGGLVLGFGGVDEAEIRAGIERIAGVVRARARREPVAT
jgi:GntR family transcriptional regulator/MocR family aminotransferase